MNDGALSLFTKTGSDDMRIVSVVMIFPNLHRFTGLYLVLRAAFNGRYARRSNPDSPEKFRYLVWVALKVFVFGKLRLDFPNDIFLLDVTPKSKRFFPILTKTLDTAMLTEPVNMFAGRAAKLDRI